MRESPSFAVVAREPERRAWIRAQLEAAGLQVVVEAETMAGIPGEPHADLVVIEPPFGVASGFPPPRAKARYGEAHRSLGEGGGRKIDEDAPEEPLTLRERDVLEWLSAGLSNKAIGERLGISEHTVKFHIASIYGKLGVSSRAQAIRRAARRGLITI